jgi:hypothetical protein
MMLDLLKATDEYVPAVKSAAPKVRKRPWLEAVSFWASGERTAQHRL